MTQVGLAAASGILAWLAALRSPPVVALYAVAFAAAAISAIDQPARTSAIPRLVPRDHLAPAIAINQAGFQTAAVVGPALGGLLIASIGLPAAYAVDAVTFGASLAALLAIAPIPPVHDAARPGLAAVLEGLRFVRRMPAILATFVVDLDAMIFGMPEALFPVLALGVFHAGPLGVGLLTAAPAAGALAGALLTGWVGRVRMQGRAVVYAVGVWGLAITGFGLATFSFPLALLLLAVAGGADVLSAVFRSTILQMATPDGLRGRVSALHLMVVTGGPRVGDMEAAGVAGLVGAQASVVSGGVLCLLGLAVVAWRLPQLWGYHALAGAAGQAGVLGEPAEP